MLRLISLICVFFFLSFSSVAQDHSKPSPIIFIYDASGSMWGQMEQKTKMQIAGKVLSDALDNLPLSQPIGLVAYGHRRKKDCRDVEFLVGMDNQDKTLIRQSLANIKPLGRTPLAYTAEQVIDQLRTSGKKATIILITDGIESCDGDLCDVIAKAKVEGIQFKMHIVGFGLKTEETKALKCAAEAGDGTYYDAADAGSLGSGLNEATMATVDSTSFVAPEKPVKNFSIVAFKNGETIDALVKAIPLDTAQEKVSSRTYADTSYFSIAPGRYDFLIKPLGGSDVQAITLEGIQVEADTPGHQTVWFDGGQISINVLLNGEGGDAVYAIYSKATGEKASSGRTYGRKKLAEINPGRYDVEVKLVRVKGQQIKHIFENVLVKGNETTALEHDFESGILSCDVTNNGVGWDASIHVFEASTNKKETGGRTYGKIREMEISPGFYQIEFRALKIDGLTAKKIIEQVEVKAGETTKVGHDFKSGEVSIEVNGNGGLLDATISIKEKNSGQSVTSCRTYVSDSSNPCIKRLSPGVYEAKVKALKMKDKSIKTITLEVVAGKKVERVVSF